MNQSLLAQLTQLRREHIAQQNSRKINENALKTAQNELKMVREQMEGYSADAKQREEEIIAVKGEISRKRTKHAEEINTKNRELTTLQHKLCLLAKAYSSKEKEAAELLTQTHTIGKVAENLRNKMSAQARNYDKMARENETLRARIAASDDRWAIFPMFFLFFAVAVVVVVVVV
jgi:hypothetical protein